MAFVGAVFFAFFGGVAFLVALFATAHRLR